MVLMYWFSKDRGSLKYKYDTLISKHINVDLLYQIVTMTYQPSSKLYASDSNDVACLVEYVFCSRSSCLSAF